MDPIPQAPIAPPTPMPPSGPQGAPIQPTPPMSQEEMKSNLQAMMAKIQPKYDAFSAAKFTGDANVSRAQSSILRQFFDVLSSYGIDPSNPDDVKQFLDKIKTANPEVYQQIEKSIGIMMGDQPTGSPSVDQGEMPQNMNTQNAQTPPTV